MYSKRATGVFAFFAVALLSIFGYVSVQTDLFKGQLILMQDAAAVNLEVLNCEQVCSDPALILNTLEPISVVEILVKNSQNSEVVFAQYIDEIEANSRYEVAFTKDLCSSHAYDQSTGQYVALQPVDCPRSTAYDFIVSGRTQDEKTPLFTESGAFMLTQ